MSSPTKCTPIDSEFQNSTVVYDLMQSVVMMISPFSWISGISVGIGIQTSRAIQSANAKRREQKKKLKRIAALCTTAAA
jgi:hypothetical protein